jgi:hypothetical protein
VRRGQSTWFAAGWRGTPWCLVSPHRCGPWKENPMTKIAQKTISDFAPKLAQLTDDVLFGDV